MSSEPGSTLRPADQWCDALFERLARDDLVAAMAEVDAIAKPRGAKP